MSNKYKQELKLSLSSGPFTPSVIALILYGGRDQIALYSSESYWCTASMFTIQWEGSWSTLLKQQHSVFGLSASKAVKGTLLSVTLILGTVEVNWLKTAQVQYLKYHFSILYMVFSFKWMSERVSLQNVRHTQEPRWNHSHKFRHKVICFIRRTKKKYQIMKSIKDMLIEQGN